jgi:hypothetical protein
MEHVVDRRAESKDVPQVAELFNCLWPNGSVAEHSSELTALLAGNFPGSLPGIVLLAEELAVAVLHLSRLIYARTRTAATLPVRSVTSRDGMLRLPTGGDESEQNLLP